ncbi:alpha/beta hydrolase [Sinorhizobium sp. 7-81]|uniref:RBBP9/YdeN family alpha/beta hydrolase n=1 Tax=Sinorhizobium sp. 8-89 TaxID=3049089 RepID=UPI0024C32D77|nr:alpha/beta hydrolase [Sinorhizobium sp. 8-89]MDK1493923.1 alpha/beta hydrolase [Sinorhizobium sp. 8-89]
MKPLIPDTETLILPGLNGSPDDHWQAHWARDNAGSRVVEQDSWTCPDLDSWMGCLERAIEAAPGDVGLVAHSLGCLLAANLASHRLTSRVRGALLVAPCDLETTEKLHPCVINFGGMPRSRLPFPSLVVASINDPYMSVERVRLTARCWGSALIDLGEAGHINIASGFGRWQTGYALFDLLRSSSKRLPIGRPPHDELFPRAATGAPLVLN